MNILEKVQKKRMILKVREQVVAALTKIIGNEDKLDPADVDKKVRDTIVSINKRLRSRNLEVELKNIRFPNYKFTINFKGCRGCHIETDCGTEFDCGYDTIIDCEECKLEVPEDSKTRSKLQPDTLITPLFTQRPSRATNNRESSSLNRCVV